MKRTASAAMRGACLAALLLAARQVHAQIIYGAPSAIIVSATSASWFTQSLALTAGAAINTTGGIDLVPSAEMSNISFTVAKPFSIGAAGVYSITGAFDGMFWSSTKYTVQAVYGIVVRTAVLDADGMLLSQVDSVPAFMGFPTLPPIADIPYVSTLDIPPAGAARVTSDLVSSPEMTLAINDPTHPYTLKQDVTVTIATFGVQPGALPTHIFLASASNLAQPRAGVPEPSGMAFTVIGTVCVTACLWRTRRRRRAIAEY